MRTKHWKVQIRVKREHIEDDQIGQYSIIAERHGRQTSEFLTSCVTLLCAGFNTPGV
ncbi:Mu-like prophage major head subunit gpT family protein [Escherichia coli]|nr:Mu-like prophage major head subunit gpT family protein [Escherichia coli]